MDMDYFSDLIFNDNIYNIYSLKLEKLMMSKKMDASFISLTINGTKKGETILSDMNFPPQKAICNV